jgi:hypothetical protein
MMWSEVRNQAHYGCSQTKKGASNGQQPLTNLTKKVIRKDGQQTPLHNFNSVDGQNPFTTLGKLANSPSRLQIRWSTALNQGGQKPLMTGRRI